jgi:hypothetical protein
VPSYKGTKDTFAVLIDGYNVVTAMDGYTVGRSAVMDSFKPLGVAFPTAIDTGQRTGTFTGTGMLDSPTTDPINSVNGTGRVVSVLSEGNTLPAAFFGFQGALVDGVELTVADGASDRLAPSYTVSGNVHYGNVVAPYATRSTAGDTKSTYATLKETSYPYATGHALVHVTAVTGAPTNLTVTITTSVDHVTWVDQTSTAVFTTPYVGAQYLTLTTGVGVQEYVAVKWAWTGGTAPTWTGFVGVCVD